MTLQDLRKYAKEMIEEGGSREQEIENCLHDIKELLNGE